MKMKCHFSPGNYILGSFSRGELWHVVLTYLKAWFDELDFRSEYFSLIQPNSLWDVDTCVPARDIGCSNWASPVYRSAILLLFPSPGLWVHVLVFFGQFSCHKQAFLQIFTVFKQNVIKNIEFFGASRRILSLWVHFGMPQKFTTNFEPGLWVAFMGCPGYGFLFYV